MRRFFINILFVLFLLSSTTGIARAKEIKFIQVTDVHYTAQNEYSREALAGAAEDINKQKDLAFGVL